MVNLKYTEILKLNKSLSKKTEGKPYNIGILSNVTVNSIKEILEHSCLINGIIPKIEFGNYDNIIQDSLSFSNKDLIIIFYETLNIVNSIPEYFEDLEDEKFQKLKVKLFNEIDIIFQNLNKTASVIFNSFSSAYFFNYQLDDSKIDLLVNELNSYIKKTKPLNVSVINIDKLFTYNGLDKSIDYRFYNSFKAPYTFSFLKSYVSNIESILIKNNGKLKKAIIFDCDNTLWSGVVGEDGINAIDMSPFSSIGKHFNFIQKLALYLRNNGVIVGLCSKNNEEDVLDVLRNHKDVVLKEDHILIHRINWLDKATNLLDIASELNIGTESLIFIDDSLFEINLVKAKMPEVLTYHLNYQISTYQAQLLKIINTHFNLSTISKNFDKTNLYREELKRNAIKQDYSLIEEYLTSLEINIQIVKNDTKNIPRISELTQKTNQFNLTTHRYTENQIKNFMENDNSEIYSISVSDKFGESGLTGACILIQNPENPTEIFIDSFMMSCRIMGRNIEFAFLNCIINDLLKKGIKFVRATYVKTKKNIPVKDFYELAGFEKNDQIIDITNYSFIKGKNKIKKINYIKVLH